MNDEKNLEEEQLCSTNKGIQNNKLLNSKSLKDLKEIKTDSKSEFIVLDSIKKKEQNNSKTIDVPLDSISGDIKNNSSIKNINIFKQNNSMIYSFPICIFKKRDPLKQLKLRSLLDKKIHKNSNNKGYILNNNLMKQNYHDKLTQDLFANDKINLIVSKKQQQTFVYTKQELIQDKTKSISTNNLFFTALPKNSKANGSTIGPLESTNNSCSSDLLKLRKIDKLNSTRDFNPYSKDSIEIKKGLQILEIEKRSNFYNKIRLAQAQRMALNNFSILDETLDYGENLKNDFFLNFSKHKFELINAYNNSNKKLPDLRSYLKYRIKLNHKKELEDKSSNMSSISRNSDLKQNKIINIKKDLFKFHIYHDRFGFTKSLDIPEEKQVKMTHHKVRDLKIMEKINRLHDPELISIYKERLEN